MYRRQIAKKTSPSLSSTPINKKTRPTPSYGSLSGTIQRATANPETLSRDEWLQLDSAIGTRATNEIRSGKRTSYVPEFKGISAQLWGDSAQVSEPIQAKGKDDVNESQVQPENKTPWVPEFKGISSQLWGDSGGNTAPIQAKLTIGAVGDKYEQEADRVAAEVVQQINTTAPVSNAQVELVQGKENKEEEGELQLKPMVQRRADAGGEASADLTSAINSARGGGQPLDAGLQQSMGQAMGADFSGVRVHTDGRSDQLNQSIQAKAFTTGQDVFFSQGAYKPGTSGGQELIAHELTHVVQQNGKGVQRKTKGSIPIDATSAETSVTPLLQRMLTLYTRGQLGYEDEGAANGFMAETIGSHRYARTGGIRYTLTDGTNTDGIKHHVPANWIYKNLIDDHIIGKTRQQVVDNLTAILTKLGLPVPAAPDERADAFDSWTSDAVDMIVDFESNLFRDEPSSGDGRGTRLDEPEDAAVQARVHTAATELQTAGDLAKKPS